MLHVEYWCVECACIHDLDMIMIFLRSVTCKWLNCVVYVNVIMYLCSDCACVCTVCISGCFEAYIRRRWCTVSMYHRWVSGCICVAVCVLLVGCARFISLTSNHENFTLWPSKEDLQGRPLENVMCWKVGMSYVEVQLFPELSTQTRMNSQLQLKVWGKKK